MCSYWIKEICSKKKKRLNLGRIMIALVRIQLARTLRASSNLQIPANTNAKLKK